MISGEYEPAPILMYGGGPQTRTGFLYRPGEASSISKSDTAMQMRYVLMYSVLWNVSFNQPGRVGLLK